MGLTCADVMVPPEKQQTIRPEASVAEALRMIRTSRARFLPVVDATGRYVGVFSSPTLVKLILPQAATIEMAASSGSGRLGNLRFLGLSREDFAAQLDRLGGQRVADNLSRPENIPMADPATPVLEGIRLIYKFKRHVMLVEPGSGRFVGTLSANSLLDQVLGPIDDLPE
ncbi:CBS domain-containing protein [Mangrovicoccus algicola]|uniref:CBS domain-containing protein n=1 Tax=Mangrovicoccus algicola TaxID=2771008 RepID=A0A8J7CL63_9RHOB|nr:CBS domain-containing protein [Mangrovicoccus algicola]MBE3639541.1 CBS domain-containing protein [Mangrovicoccus algicola]